MPIRKKSVNLSYAHLIMRKECVFTDNISLWENKKRGRWLTYNTLKEWIWSASKNLIGQSLIYKKVIFINERQRNEFKSFANAHNVQMSTRRKCSKLSFRLDATGPSSGINRTWISLWLFLRRRHQVMILDMGR